MKIAFIGQKGIPTKSGGVDRHVESLAMFLAMKGSQVIVYNRRGYLPEKINEWKGVKLVHLPFINQKNLAAITHSLLATFDALRRKVNVIHYHGIGPSLLAWIPRLLAPKIKVITTLHSFDYSNDKWNRFAKFMLKLGEKSMCKYAHEVIVLTEVMRDYLLQRHNRQSVIIPNGAYIQASVGDKHLLPYGLTKGNYIITVSRLIRLKGIQYLIKAFKNLAPKDVKLAIVGDGEYSNELERLSANDSQIIFTGNQTGEALNQLYANAKLFVQSSEMEGLSISLLEAMAHGLPCLASDIVANKQATGEAALYFISKDVVDLEKKLKYALEHPTEMQVLGAQAQERAKQLFDWDKIAYQTLEIYKKTSN